MRARWSSYFFILPALVFMLLFTLFPVLYNILISFQNVTITNLTGIHEFVGWSNYKLIFGDPLFYVALKNSVVFTLTSIILQFVIGFACALFFNQNFPGKNVLRSLLLLAWMLPLIITATLFSWLMSGDYGVFNHILQSLGIIDKPQFWLGQSNTALYATILANVWVGVPFNMIILLSGLQSLPESLFEAAKIDGASRSRRFWHITLPLMRPTILILLMLIMIYTFKVFDLIFIMTGGGPVNATTVLPIMAYDLAFKTYEFSLGSAVSNIMLVVLIMIAVVYLWMIQKEEKQ